MNQSFLGSKHLRVAGLLCAVVVSLGVGAVAQAPQAEANRPFTLDGRTWASQHP